MRKIRIGTRKSRLAMIQTELVIEAYKKVWQEFEYEIVPMSTKGDEQLKRSLSSFGGKGVFVTEIEDALRDGTIDLAVHSAKDLPLPIGEGLTIAATPVREDARDVLVIPRKKYEQSASGSDSGNALIVEAGNEDIQKVLRNCQLKAVGTGSMRRQYQLKQLIGAESKEIRGNVPTRLSKLNEGTYDAVMLAAAGLKRLGMDRLQEYAYIYMDAAQFLPAPCQGIIAVEAREGDPLIDQYALIQDSMTRRAFELERRVMEETGGSCKDIVGALAVPAKGMENCMEMHVLFNGEYTKKVIER